MISHALKNTSIQAITHLVLLEPTSPLTSLKDLDRAIEILFKKKEFNSVVSLISNLKFSNTYNIKVNVNGNCVFKKNVQNNRQNVNQSFYLSGNFYISKIKTLLSKKTFYTKKTFGYKIKEEYYTDIDNHLDLMIARLKYNKLYKKNEL